MPTSDLQDREEKYYDQTKEFNPQALTDGKSKKETIVAILVSVAVVGAILASGACLLIYYVFPYLK